MEDKNQCFSGVTLICYGHRNIRFFSPLLPVAVILRWGVKGEVSMLMKGRSQGKLLFEREVSAFMNGRVGVPKIITF